MCKVGDRLRIIDMEGEPHYAGKEGTIQYIAKDPWGDVFLSGTWGGCNIYPNKDRFEVIG